MVQDFGRFELQEIVRIRLPETNSKKFWKQAEFCPPPAPKKGGKFESEPTMDYIPDTQFLYGIFIYVPFCPIEI